MDLTQIKVYRLGPIAAFDRSAHSVSQILLSNYFARYGVESYLYLRSLEPEKSVKQLEEFLGIEFSENLKVFTTVRHKGLSTAINFSRLVRDVLKNRSSLNVIFLSKASHVLQLRWLKKVANVRIVFENHQTKPFAEAVASSDLNYVVCPEVYRELSKEFPHVKLWNYHYPVGDYLFQPVKRLKRKERYLLGYLGSLLPEKGLGFLFRALKELPQFDLLVVGGNERQVSEAKRVAEKEGVSERVRFTGFVPQREIPGALSEADIMVAPFTPSQRTIPLKVYEYMALGKPVISSGIEAVKVVAEDYFIYFKPEDERDFKLKLEEMIGNLEDTNRKTELMRKKAESFRWQNVIEKMLSDVLEVS